MDTNEDEFLDLDPEQTDQASGNAELLKRIASIHKLLKELTLKLGGKYPAPGYAYPKPEKMEELEKRNAELEEKVKKFEEEVKPIQDLEKEKADLEAKLKSYEQKEKEAKVTDYLNDLEEKGLIQSDQREELFKEFAEKFSVEQLQAIIDVGSKMDFAGAKQKSFKSKELPKEEGKDFAKRKADLEKKISTLKSANVGGPILEEYESELKALEEGS